MMTDDIEQHFVNRSNWLRAAILGKYEGICIQRELDEQTAIEVTHQLTTHNTLEAHARVELGWNDISQANPLQAAFASGAAFTCGGILRELVSLFAPIESMVIAQYQFLFFFLSSWARSRKSWRLQCLESHWKNFVLGNHGHGTGSLGGILI